MRQHQALETSHGSCDKAFDISLDSHHLWRSDTWLCLRFAFGYPQLRFQCQVYLSSGTAAFGALDVERACCSATFFQEYGVNGKTVAEHKVPPLRGSSHRDDLLRSG